MTSTKKLADRIREAEKVADSPEHLEQLLHADGVQVEYSRKGGDNLVSGWKVRLDNPQAEWIKGSEITADRAFTWPNVAKRKGWPLPSGRAASGNTLEQFEPEAVQKNDTSDALEFLSQQVVVKPKTQRSNDQEMAQALDELAALIATLAQAVRAAVVRLVNALLRVAGVDYQLELKDSPVAARAGSGQSKEDERREAALSAVRALVGALKSNDPAQLPPAPGGDAGAAYARARLADELGWKRWLASATADQLQRKEVELGQLRLQDLQSPSDLIFGGEVAEIEREMLDLLRARDQARLAEDGALSEFEAQEKTVAAVPVWNLFARSQAERKIVELAEKVKAARSKRLRAEESFRTAEARPDVREAGQKRRELLERYEAQKRANALRIQQIQHRIAVLKQAEKSRFSVPAQRQEDKFPQVQKPVRERVRSDDDEGENFERPRG